MNQLSKKINEGVSVYKNSHSPSGYTATFIYKPTQDIIKVSLTGPFFYIDPNMDLYDKDNIFTPHEYRNGMYASSLAPGTFQRNYIEDMIYDPELSIYRLDIPITSGAFPYSYIITYQDYTQETIDDPANPSPSKMNNQSYYKNASLKQSIVYGYYDKMKQSQSPYLDYVLPSKKKNGSLFFVKYEGNLSKNQDLGIYLPSNYNENTQPYKVIYASHGYTGNETDWFSMGNIHHIIDNFNEQVIVVTMENSSYELDFMKMYERIGMVEDNIINYIIPYIEKNYNVSKKASDRAFCGISMG
ncbi:MAG: alpha/beta hydrolase-fold protein, partial [Faecalibacillus intestinalis]